LTGYSVFSAPSYPTNPIMRKLNPLFPVLNLLLLMPAFSASLLVAQGVDFSTYPVYEGNDLGISWSPAATRIRVWAPSAEALRWQFYATDLGGTPQREVYLRQDVGGTWVATLPGNWEGSYYTVQAQFDGTWLAEVPDPYARAVGRNGQRGQIYDPLKTNPPGWEQDQRVSQGSYTDIVLYEGHVRDLTVGPGSGIRHQGKFLGLSERGTRSPEGNATGLDHLVELGVTHLHLLPFFDYGSLDETKAEPGYNWGYDPLNYNAPEGTYCTNPADGASRIRELKTTVQALHNAGIGLVMDVVYNHTYSVAESVFSQLVPGYYYRQWPEGNFSDASGCGNEVASERPMVRKFIRESLQYWASEFHLDGFRFDLMGIHDQQTMRLIREDMNGLDPHIFLYGEGWTAGPSPLPEEQRAIKRLTWQLPGIAAFSDDIRDGIKGHWSDEHDPGFASGKGGLSMTIRAGLVGGIAHPDVDFSRVNYSPKPWVSSPSQVINYVSCHDNHTLYDKVALSAPEASEPRRLAIQRLANTIVLMAQGVPFLHEGVEMAYTKGGDHNSYKSPDKVNALDWNRKADYADLVDYHRALIALRKAHPVFRMNDPDLIRRVIRFPESGSEHVVIQHADAAAAGDTWKELLLIFNGSDQPYAYTLPGGTWNLVGNGRVVVSEPGEGLLTLKDKVEVAPSAAYILAR
jgi:pullulanase